VAAVDGQTSSAPATRQLDIDANMCSHA
jgi:hypothetical protein